MKKLAIIQKTGGKPHIFKKDGKWKLVYGNTWEDQSAITFAFRFINRMNGYHTKIIT